MNLYISDVNIPERGKENFDIRIENGTISDIIVSKSRSKLPENIQLIDGKGLTLIPSLCDIGAFIGEPGYEHRETLHAFSMASLRGGVTDVAVLPNLNPVTDSASKIKQLKDRSNELPIHLHPLGAASTQLDGKNIAELRDMYESGCVGFTQGYKPFPADLLLRTLEYSKSFKTLILAHAASYDLIIGAQVHEDENSMQMGLRGYPSFIETMAIERDLQLLKYTGSHLHFLAVSTAESVDLIRKAKAENLNISASVSINNLIFNSDSTVDFDSNFKLKPPLRSENDRLALIQGLKEGTIDCIISQHIPWDKESKDLEFTYAEYGSIGIQTLVSAWNTYLSNEMTLEQFLQSTAINPRKILNLPEVVIEKGAKASFALFDKEHSWVFDESGNESRSTHGTLWKKELKGIVKACYTKGQYHNF